MTKSQTKEPWLACCYSIIVPGSGHLYGDKRIEGIAWILIYILSIALFIYSLLADECPLYVSLIIGILSSFGLPVYCSYSSYMGIKKRKKETSVPGKNVWIALFLSMYFPPLGYLYLKKWLSSAVCFLAVVIVFMFTDFPGNSILFSVFVCFHIALLIFKIKEKSKKNFFILMAVFFTFGVINDLLYISVCKKYLFDIVHITRGVSMNPTLYAGDKVIADIYGGTHEQLKVGEIVFLPSFMINNEYGKESLVKRIVAVGGENVQIIDDIVYINNQPTNRLPKYIEGIHNSHGSYYEYGVNEPYKVPENCYFILGDNLNNSGDSRRFGAVGADQIHAKITKILWPLSRIGVVQKPKKVKAGTFLEGN